MSINQKINKLLSNKAAGTAVMNGSQTTVSDLAAGALAGGLGGVNDVAGAAAAVAVESVKIDEENR